MKENKFYSYNKGNLPKGCQLCIKGRKMVLFITGICPRNCWYCSVGDKKYQKDVIYANELKVEKDQDLINEVKKSAANGAGITGGDPLAKIERTIKYIKLLKKKFGKNFHIHLYTSLNLLTKEIVKKLEEANLDEIRIHADIESNALWKKFELLKNTKMSKALEIPLIPDKEKETKKLLSFIKNKVDFINLNELESADTEHNENSKRGYKAKDYLSYAAKGSLELGLKLIEELNLDNVHLCTAKLKDSTQLSNRLKIRSQITKKPYDLVTEEGSFIRGVIYLEKPSFNYTEKLKQKNKEEEIKKLKKIKNNICQKLKITKKDLYIDETKYRFLLSTKIVKKKKDLIKSLGYFPAIVEEYPTSDMFEIEIDFL